MATKCYAMVRGSAIRITALNGRGSVGDPVRYATSKSVAKVTINEVTESGNNEVLRNDEDASRLLFVRPEQLIRYTVDIDFLRVDPGLLALVTGVDPVTGNRLGFGEMPFGSGPFGSLTEEGAKIGFDARTKRPTTAFALEVWTRLAGMRCNETALPQWGYTLFPFLRGGHLSGFAFTNGAVTFNLRGAQTRKVSRWGVGPYDLEGPHQRLTEVVSGNVAFRQMITTATPPVEADGIHETYDVIDGGSASMTSEDVIDGGNASGAGPWIVRGGRAV